MSSPPSYRGSMREGFLKREIKAERTSSVIPSVKVMKLYGFGQRGNMKEMTSVGVGGETAAVGGLGFP